MNEVSCRVFEIFERPLKAKGLSLAKMVAGTTVPAAKFDSKRERIDWAEFVAIMKNVRPHFTDAEYIAAGRDYLSTPGLRFAFVIARIALSPIDVYRWLNQPRQGLGNQMFTCVVPIYREVAADKLVMELTVPEDFEVCWDFFVIASGTLEHVPQLFGLPAAKVVLSPIPRGCRFEILVPTWRVPFRKRVARWVEWPFMAWTAARELKEAHETLVDVQSRMGDVAQRLRQAEQLSTLGVLTSGLAHEIRNPANGIANAIEPLLEQLPKEIVGPETGPGQLLEVLSDCAQQLSFLSRQLLGFKRDQGLELAPANLTELIKRAIRMAQRALTQVDVRTVFVVDQPIQCSGPLLVQALANLIENAGHAVGPGGWVQISTKISGNLVQIEVSDSGTGVPVALRERIFEPFVTTKAPGMGTGLGLSVSRAIVQRHRGVLEIRQRDGRSAFVIEFPHVSDSPTAVLLS